MCMMLDIVLCFFFGICTKNLSTHFNLSHIMGVVNLSPNASQISKQPFT